VRITKYGNIIPLTPAPLPQGGEGRKKSKESIVKLAGFLLLLAGWIIVLAAILLLGTVPVRAAFLLAGMGVEMLGLALVARSHLGPRKEKE
jgi:hypothetical protein